MVPGGWRRRGLWLTLAACAAVAACRTSPPRAELRSLNHALSTSASATAVLEQWCASHHLAPPDAHLRAERVTGVETPPVPAVRRALRVGPAEQVRYRHVRLRCGTVVLSEADNWYVPARLTPAMNATLDSTDEPFGRVVQPLGFRRVRLTAGRPHGQSAVVLEHRAVLTLPDGTPFSYVIESYQRAALGPP